MNNAFCTRCGSAVEKYSANEAAYLADGLIGGCADIYNHRFDSPRDVPPGLCTYECAACRAVWVAASANDTGLSGPCGHFIVYYSDFCGVCGRRTG